MKRARVGSFTPACCVAALIALVPNEMLVRPSASAAASDRPAEFGQGFPQPGAHRARARLDSDDSLGVTEARAVFARDASPICFALTGFFEFNEGGIVLVYRPLAVGRKLSVGHESVPGVGRIATFEEDDCRIRLQVSFDDRSAAAGQEQAAPSAGIRGADRMRFRQLVIGDGWPSEGVVILPVTAEKRPRGPCLAGTGLFSLEPRGFSVLFHRRRSELPFHVEERVSQDQRNVALVFSTSACRMTLTVEKEVRRGDEWVRLAPVE